jgi:hypothetical protein
MWTGSPLQLGLKDLFFLDQVKEMREVILIIKDGTLNICQ